MNERNEIRGLLTLVLGPPVFVFVIAIGFAGSLWEAWVAWTIYGWHIVPLGAPLVPFAAVVGADMILTMMTTHLIPDRDPKVSRLWVRFIPPALALCLAWWLR